MGINSTARGLAVGRDWLLPRHLRVAFMLFLLLEELDLVTSLAGRNGVVEGNALMALVLSVGGGFAFLLVKLIGSAVVYWGVAQISQRSRAMAHAVILSASMMMIVVVVSNLRLVLS